MADDVQDHRSMRAASALFVAIALLIGWDLIADYREGAQWGHIAVELIVLLVAATGAVLLWGQFRQTRLDLAVARVDAEQWRNESRTLLRGLGVAIDKQFSAWKLTKAESEVALFLLKGFSHKEIASMRHTSERTAREQARALYRKSGLSGRSSLSAFFLEDLLLPQCEGEDIVEAPGQQENRP
ncbi:MAG TPA: hypothetical protein PKK10_14770 [Woeseiaceae bacterium]|nr:hypothetical protein [Woeseiaceae bacterium]